MRTTVSEDEDPILQVTGVAAAEILARCARIRGTPMAIGVGGLARSLNTVKDVGSVSLRKKKKWQLGQFGQGTNEEFVQQAYVAMLGRAPTHKEVRQRLRQLSAGSTRLGILARLMFSFESYIHRPRVRGSVLKTIKTLSRYWNRNPKKRNVPSDEKAVGSATYAILSAKKTPIFGTAFEVILTLPKIGKMRRDIIELKDEVRRLNARLER